MQTNKRSPGGTPSENSRAGFVAIATFLGIVLAASSGFGFTPPKVGHRYLTVGMAGQPGFLADDDAPPDIGTRALGVGSLMLVGFQHVVAPSIYMAAEISFGNQWLDTHTAHRDGHSDSETALAGQVSVLGRWVPGGADGGLSLGAGGQYFEAALDDASIQVYGIETRVGAYLWKDEEFALVEVGYIFPFIQGLSLPTDYSGMGTSDVIQDWAFHRFILSVQWGF